MDYIVSLELCWFKTSDYFTWISWIVIGLHYSVTRSVGRVPCDLYEWTHVSLQNNVWQLLILRKRNITNLGHAAPRLIMYINIFCNVAMDYPHTFSRYIWRRYFTIFCNIAIDYPHTFIWYNCKLLIDIFSAILQLIILTHLADLIVNLKFVAREPVKLLQLHAWILIVRLNIFS